MPHIHGIKGEAVVVYCEPLITKEMGYHRLSRRVNKMMKQTSDDNASILILSQLIYSREKANIIDFFYICQHFVYAQLREEQGKHVGRQCPQDWIIAIQGQGFFVRVHGVCFPV
jgi:hypothetical protein